jgi:hypothetical protein
MINVRKIMFGSLALFLGTVAASAQTYTLTLNGTVTGSSGAYANPGDAFNSTFTLRSPVQMTSPPMSSFLATASAPGDDPFQDTTTTGTHTTTTGESGTAPDGAAAVTIFSGYAGFGHPPTTIYGYQFNSDADEVAPATYQPGYEFWQMTVDLESTDSFVAPTGTLADLGNFPVSDFNYVNSFSLTLEQATYSGMTFTGYTAVATESGTVTSYTIQSASTPEPATWALFLVGAMVIGAAVRGRRIGV